VLFRSIGGAWQLWTSARATVVAGLSSGVSVQADSNLDVVYTTFKLLEYAEMHSYIIISQFLRGHPKVYEISSLYGEISIFIGHVRALGQIPARQRPFYKLILGDKTSIFKRTEYTRLLGLAVGILARTNDKIRRFQHEQQLALEDQLDLLEGVDEENAPTLVPESVAS